MEFGYNKSDFKLTPPSGETLKSSSALFTQRYNLNMSKTLYPLISLNAGGIFQNAQTESTAGGGTSRGSSTEISPFLNLSWGDKMFPLNLGYQRREEKSESNGLTSPTTVLETYNASLGWRPVDLPPWDFSYLRTNRFDQDRLFSDSSSSSFQWSTNYRPSSKLIMSYQGAYSTNTDRLGHLENDTLSNNGRIGYVDQFFNRRVDIATNYNLSTSQSSISATGQGDIFAPVPPFGQTPVLLFKVTPDNTTLPPVSVTTGQLGSFPPQGVNIVTATLPQPVPQDNFGLDLARTLSANIIYLPVVSGTNNPRPTEVSRVAALFLWSVYVSDNGTDWTAAQTPVTSFGTDPSGRSDTVGFILDFGITPLSSRFVKAVVSPVLQINLLSFGPFTNVDPSSIVVTGIQAFLRQPAASFPGGKFSSISGQYSLSSKVKILDVPSLNYEMIFTLAHDTSEGTSSVSYAVSNGLSLSHRFNEIFSGFARVSFNNSQNQGGPTTSTANGSASLTVTPLPTLSHSLVYSSQIGYTGSQEITSNSLFLTNTAQLYQGVALSLSGGFSAATDSTGRKGDSAVLNAGLSLTPHKTLTLSMSYGETASKSSGGGKPDATSDVRTIATAVTYNPFATVYLSAQWGLSAQSVQPTTTSQNYAVTWSPFGGGAVQITIPFNENITLPDNTKTQTVAPTLRWNIRAGTTLDVGYSWAEITNPATSTTDVNSWTTTLRIAL